MMLRRAAGMPNLEPPAAKRRSQAIAMAIAPPIQNPKIMATVGFGQTRMALYAASVCRPYSSAVSVSLRCSLNSEMSAPEANASLPAPRYTMARTESSLERLSVTAAISVHIARLIALRTSGRLKVTVAMALSCSTRIWSLIDSLQDAQDHAGCEKRFAV